MIDEKVENQDSEFVTALKKLSTCFRLRKEAYREAAKVAVNDATVQTLEDIAYVLESVAETEKEEMAFAASQGDLPTGITPALQKAINDAVAKEIEKHLGAAPKTTTKPKPKGGKS